MSLRALILIASILGTNAYPYSQEYEAPNVGAAFPIPDQQFLQQNTDQYASQVPFDDYFSAGDTKLAEEQSDFTISCAGENRICTSKNECIDGYVQIDNGVRYPVPATNQQCKINAEVCCTVIAKGPQSTSVKSKPNDEALDASAAFALAIPLQNGCAAALICVEERFCTLDGMISPDPVEISEKQLFRQVPLSSCRNPDNGVIGKCCRDPNYVDPWPTGNLPANYSGGFDEQGFPTFLNIAKVRPPKKQDKQDSTPAPANTHVFPQTLTPPRQDANVPKPSDTFVPTTACGIRNKASQGPQPETSTTAFGEIPWQAMVLHAKDRKILCSGTLVDTKSVLTAANCVDRLQPNDVSIKLGEWKLGYQLKNEEPLPFEILNVSSISVHPEYKQGYGEHDLAMIHLENHATLDQHVNPLCLPESAKPTTNNCITTGWGKSILQAHYAGAIMNVVDMDVLSSQRCKERLAYADINANIADNTICATTKAERDNVCETDVGGPLACQNANGYYELTGIYSQDTGCQPTNQVAMFAPLDDKWLKETVSDTIPQQGVPNVSVENYRKSSLLGNNGYLPPN